MTQKHTVPWESLEHRSASALLVAGGLHLVVVALNVLPIVSSLSPPELAGDLTLGATYVVAFTGLLGLVPRLREATPRLARAGSVLAGLATIGILAVAIGEPVLTAFGYGEQPPPWFAPVALLYLIGGPLCFLLFGVASVRTDIPSRSVGAALLAVFVSLLFFFHLIPLPIEGLLAQLPASVIAVSLIAGGYRLRTASASPAKTEPSGETVTR